MSGLDGRPGSPREPGARAGPSLHEARALWLVWGLLALLTWVTYARLPVRDVYNVSGTGVRAGAGRMLVLLGWPISVAAPALLAVACDRLLGLPLPRSRRRLLIGAAVVSVLLCATVAWPGVVSQSDLDAKPANALAAIGVGIAAVVTAVAIHRTGLGPRLPLTPGDRFAVVLIAAMTLPALPWIFANLGIFVGDVPGLSAVFMSKAIVPEPGHPHLQAVHLGNHEGLDGWLLAATALGLRRALRGMRVTRLRTGLGCYLALMLPYGLMVAANDGWHEQLVKRGSTSFMLPDVITPGFTWGWAILLAAAALLYVTAFRVRDARRGVAAIRNPV